MRKGHQQESENGYQGKGMSEKSIAIEAPYGYIKDPQQGFWDYQ